MQLFENKIRTRTDSKGFSEPDYSYLNESAHPHQERIRILLEKWFAAYPSSHQAHVARPFQSLNNRQYLGAFFELYCHELLRSQGFDVEVEPLRGMTKGKRIDFLASKNNNPLFYQEATICIGNNEMEGSQTWLDNLCDSLNNLVSPHFRLHMRALRMPLPSGNMPSTKTMRKYVEKQLATCDPNQMLAEIQAKGLQSVFLYKFESKGWTIMIYLRPVFFQSAEFPVVQALSSISYPAGKSFDREVMPLLASLDDKKPSEYGNLDLPYIIAVDATDTITPRNTHEVLINQRYFENQPRVSGVLMANELIPRAISKNTAVLWRNPYATYPLDQDAWLLPQKEWNEQISQWIYREGKRGDELFNLDANWPG